MTAERYIASVDNKLLNNTKFCDIFKITGTSCATGGGSMKKRVLVVDDSPIALAMAREALEEGGFEVITALDAKEADTCIYGNNRPDLVILDVMLPMLDGDKKAKLLKGNELTSDIPILLMSSKPEEELCLLVHESGADGFIRKPFGHQQIVARVEDTLREKTCQESSQYENNTCRRG
jgi:DNA-binding response OmpR family regulator